MSSAHGGPGHEVTDGIDGIPGTEAGESVYQPGMGPDAVEFAARDRAWR